MLGGTFRGRHFDLCKKKHLMHQVKNIASEYCRDLVFTTEELVEGVLQFLEMRLLLNEWLHWMYGKRSPKHMLSGNSAHPKSVKSGLVTLSCTMLSIARAHN